MVQKYKTSERSMIMIPMKYICLLILALIFGSHDHCLSHLNASISPNDTSDIVSQDLICVKLDGEKSKILTITEKTNALTINADIEVSWYIFNKSKSIFVFNQAITKCLEIIWTSRKND